MCPSCAGSGRFLIFRVDQAVRFGGGGIDALGVSQPHQRGAHFVGRIEIEWKFGPSRRIVFEIARLPGWILVSIGNRRSEGARSGV